MDLRIGASFNRRKAKGFQTDQVVGSDASSGSVHDEGVAAEQPVAISSLHVAGVVVPARQSLSLKRDLVVVDVSLRICREKTFSESFNTSRLLDS